MITSSSSTVSANSPTGSERRYALHIPAGGVAETVILASLPIVKLFLRLPRHAPRICHENGLTWIGSRLPGSGSRKLLMVPLTTSPAATPKADSTSSRELDGGLSDITSVAMSLHS